jgi:hypothetical protein
MVERGIGLGEHRISFDPPPERSLVRGEPPQREPTGCHLSVVTGAEDTSVPGRTGRGEAGATIIPLSPRDGPRVVEVHQAVWPLVSSDVQCDEASVPAINLVSFMRAEPHDQVSTAIIGLLDPEAGAKDIEAETVMVEGGHTRNVIRIRGSPRPEHIGIGRRRLQQSTGEEGKGYDESTHRVTFVEDDICRSASLLLRDASNLDLPPPGSYISAAYLWEPWRARCPMSTGCGVSFRLSVLP